MATRTGRTRQNEQMGWVNAALADCCGRRSAALQARLVAATPWETLAAPIRTLPEYRNRDAGHPPWCPVLTPKWLMRQKWFKLSDPGLDEALRDRICFRKFAALSFTDKTPDEATFVRFRDRLRSAGLQENRFNAVFEHIDDQGLLVREGTMVAATIIEALRGRKRPDGTSIRDGDVSSTRKHGRTHHGYKGHLAADVSGIVVESLFGTAKKHDSRHIADLTRQERNAVFADSDCSDRARRQALRQRGVIDAIAYTRLRGHTNLFGWQKRRNTLTMKYRARVEHPFAMLKQQLGCRRARYRGLMRNAFDLVLTTAACNITRSLSLRIA